ncbi:MAG: hypothetical protein ACJAR9_001292 [Celeribacter sp.]|jgi:hypothetical protein
MQSPEIHPSLALTKDDSGLELATTLKNRHRIIRERNLPWLM